MLEIGSDYSGVGAFEQALNRLGFKYKKTHSCDIDKYSRKTYINNYGTKEDLKILKSKDCKFVDDIMYRLFVDDNLKNPTKKDVEKANLLSEKVANKFSFYFPWNVYNRNIYEKPLDIYITSPPCQGFSIAGKREGSILFLNSHEFIEKNKPRFFVFENVKGLLSHNKKDKKKEFGNTFNQWLNYLGGKSVNGNPVLFPVEESVPYHIYFKVLNAKNFGVPQNRERIFIVGIRDDEDNIFSWPKEESLDKCLKDVLENNVDEKYYLSQKMIQGFVSKRNNNFQGRFEPKNGDEKYFNCITTNSGTRKTDNYIFESGYINQDTQASQVHSKEKECPTISAGSHGYANGYISIAAMRGRNPENPTSRITGLPTEQILEFNKNGTSNTITTVQKDNLVVIQGCGRKSQAERIYSTEGVSCPISGGCGGLGCKTGLYKDKTRIRRLTPRECFRLMDFPEEFSWNVSDSQAYKQAGNSIVVSVLEKIIKKLNL